jgi:N-acetylmuramoyl-L-alanine amidase
MAVVALCCALAVSVAAPDQQLTVYTAQTSYSLPVLERGGKAYIALTDLLSPLGAPPPVGKGKEWRFTLNKTEFRLTEGKEKATIHNEQPIDVGGKVLAENGHAMVPMDAALALLGRLLHTTIDFHQPARRLFVGNTFTRFTAEYKNGDQPSLVLNFSQPVKANGNHDEKAGILTKTNTTTLVFPKDPVVSDLKTQQYGDGAIQSLSFSEENGTALLTVTGNKQLQIIRSDDGKTVTLQPQAPEASATPSSAQPSPRVAAEGQKRLPEFFVMIDPSHGGTDKGASFGGNLVEKDITLRLARELRKELEERGIAARLLRESDIELSLDRRAEITNEQHAAIYVALHAGRPGKGVRVYASLLTDAQQPIAGRFLSWESAQSGALNRSQTAARAVADELRKKAMVVANLGMPLRPLNNIAAPAIAVELAPDEDDPHSLDSPRRQTNIATAIALGIAQVRSQMGVRP